LMRVVSTARNVYAPDTMAFVTAIRCIPAFWATNETRRPAPFPFFRLLGLATSDE
jgi:hypothetical protein